MNRTNEHLHQTLAQAKQNNCFRHWLSNRTMYRGKTGYRLANRRANRAAAARQLLRGELETQGSGGAPQPAESAADASQVGGLPTVRVKLGCFNCGIDQAMLSKDKRQKHLSRVIANAVHEQDLRMVTLCEVGGHKEGLGKSTVRAQDLVSQVLTGHYKATSCQAYMATWQAEHEPTDDTSVTLTLSGEPEVVELPFLFQPQLVIMDFTIAASEHRDKHGNLISGNLRIRCPQTKGQRSG